MTTSTTAAVASAEKLMAARPRRQWVDNVRVAVIVGVIGAHVSIIYALDVGWYYEERTASEVTKALLAAIFSPGLLFGMGLMFFVAGLFTPPAFERKGARRFAVDRLWRLGFPSVAYVFVVNPAMDFLGDRAYGDDASLSDYLRDTYRGDVEFGVAWFIVALLAFSFVYAAWRSRHPADDGDIVPIRRSNLLAAMAFIASGSFAVRLIWPFLATDRAWGMNLWEYPQMLALFALGVLAEERGWLRDGLPPDVRRVCGRMGALGVGLAALVGVAITISDNADPWTGGFHLEATVIPMVEAMITVGMSLWAVDWFRRRWNKSGTLTQAMGRGSFVAYLVHAPITVVLAVALRDVGVPAEIKFVSVFVATVVVSFAVGERLTRRGVSGRIL